VIVHTLVTETVHLLPERALFWPRKNMLVIADIHFGKAAAFRAQAIPVPHGTTAENLSALDALIAQHAVAHIVFLGDFLHAKTARSPATLAALQRWRATHAALRLTLVRGNHDLHAGDPPVSLNIEVVDEPWCVDGFAFCHHPDTVTQAYVIAGHVHPVYRLKTGSDTLRLPCFLIGPTRAILPSFGAFTGGYAVTPDVDERVVVTAGSTVFSIPQTRLQRRTRL
jgi:DNA ligase-associated metallophosphoesterase